MGKTKRTDEIFTLKKELRESQETITTLEKQLLKYQKGPEIKQTREEKRKAKRLEKEAQSNGKEKCPKCLTGDIVYGDLGVREIIACSKKCGYKEIVRKSGKEEKA